MPQNSFDDIDITENDVANAFRSMNSDSSPGIDNIFPKFLKNISTYLVKPLTLIFRCSLLVGAVPIDWKTSIIVPIYKKNKKPHACSSYRPINLTCCVSKLMERVIHQKLMFYLRENNLISDVQHGFLTKRSTVTNLLSCTFDWVSYFNERKAFDIVYIDYEKAFDKVSHPKMLYKLSKMGVGGCILKWLECFMTNRMQSVKVNDSFSSFETVDSGVAQGTLLGPLMFILFLNDVENIIDHENCSIILYADDSKTYGASGTINECEKMQQNLSRLAQWCENWQLSINMDKCEVLHVGKNNLNYQYEMNGLNITSKHYCRDLGVLVGDDLYYRTHYENIARIGHYNCKMLRNSFACRDIAFLVFLYKTYIMPKIEYACNVWSPYYKKDVDLIEDVQRKFTKLLPGMFDVSYNERLIKLDLLTLEERRIHADLILLYKIIHKLVDIPFDKYFTYSPSTTRGHPYKLFVPFSRVNCHKYHFFNRIVNIWNCVPEDIVILTKLGEYKSKIVTFNVKRYCIGRAFA